MDTVTGFINTSTQLYVHLHSMQGAKYPTSQWNQCCTCSFTEATLQSYNSHIINSSFTISLL